MARCVSLEWCDENGPPPRATYGGKDIANLKAAYNLKTAELLSRSISQGKPIDFNDYMVDGKGELVPTTQGSKWCFFWVLDVIFF